MENKINDEVTEYIEDLKHPLQNEIFSLRKIIMSSSVELKENIKWNAPNYLHNGKDRITMRIQPQNQIQVIFHRGSKKIEQPKEKIIKDYCEILLWKENDRAIATFKNSDEIEKNKKELLEIIIKWIESTKMD